MFVRQAVFVFCVALCVGAASSTLVFRRLQAHAKCAIGPGQWTLSGEMPGPLEAEGKAFLERSILAKKNDINSKALSGKLTLKDGCPDGWPTTYQDLFFKAPFDLVKELNFNFRRLKKYPALLPKFQLLVNWFNWEHNPEIFFTDDGQLESAIKAHPSFCFEHPDVQKIFNFHQGERCYREVTSDTDGLHFCFGAEFPNVHNDDNNPGPTRLNGYCAYANVIKLLRHGSDVLPPSKVGDLVRALSGLEKKAQGVINSIENKATELYHDASKKVQDTVNSVRDGASNLWNRITK